MKKIFTILTVIFITLGLSSQDKVAVLDFENISGITKYDGLGMVMSNMIITDLSNYIHPRKIIFMERIQLNKILDEQNLQSTKRFDQIFI